MNEKTQILLEVIGLLAIIMGWTATNYYMIVAGVILTMIGFYNHIKQLRSED
jgi:uncharacterized membrane protein